MTTCSQHFRILLNMRCVMYIYVLYVNLRICVWLLLNCRQGSFYALFAPVCSSWVGVNQATSRRTIAFPWGDLTKEYIVRANTMCSRLGRWLYEVCLIVLCMCYRPSKAPANPSHMPKLGRTVLLCALVTALGGSFFVEQPGSSLMEYYDKMVWLSRVLPVSSLQFMIALLFCMWFGASSDLAVDPPWPYIQQT